MFLVTLLLVLLHMRKETAFEGPKTAANKGVTKATAELVHLEMSVNDASVAVPVFRATWDYCMRWPSP